MSTVPESIASPAPSGAGARLLIRVEADAWPPAGRLAHAARTLRRWLGARAHPPGATPALLEVSAWQGPPLLVLREPHGVVELPLRAGTYQITVRQGGTRRGYTVALAPGATFSLDLSEAARAPRAR